MDNAQLAGDVKAATDCYKAMRDNRDKTELAMGAKVKKAQAARDKAAKLATKLVVAQVEQKDDKEEHAALHESEHAEW